MFCAEGTVLSVLSGLNPRLSEEEVKEEMMRCFSPIPTRRQAIEMIRTMHQEDNEQMHQYIVRHEVAHTRAHRISPDDQISSSEIIEFTMTLQPIIQDKLSKKIDGDRPPIHLREAYHQALDLERKNQIMKRYETTVQVSQISDCALGEDIEEVDAMELHPRDNTKRVFHGNDRDKRNFSSVERGSFSRGSQDDNQGKRQNYEGNLRGNTRGRYNQNQSRFNSGMKQETHKQPIMENKTRAKEITEAFFAVMGQEISEEEASLIQNIQLLEDEVDCQNEDLEASEEESTTT